MTRFNVSDLWLDDMEPLWAVEALCTYLAALHVCRHGRLMW